MLFNLYRQRMAVKVSLRHDSFAEGDKEGDKKGIIRIGENIDKQRNAIDLVGVTLCVGLAGFYDNAASYFIV